MKSSGEKNPLDDNDVSVHSAISVNGRLYIVPKSHSEKTLVCKNYAMLDVYVCMTCFMYKYIFMICIIHGHR